MGNIPFTPPLGQGKIKVGVRLIFRYMGGVGEQFLGNIPLTPSLGQGKIQGWG